jgi:phosphatidylserine decarboxylase
MKPPRRHRPRIGRWLPPHHHVEAWVGELSRQVARKKKARLHPAVEAFRRLIDEDPTVRMYVTRMIAEVPDAKPYQINHVRSAEEMLAMIDEVMGRAPEFDTTALVGAPLNAILDWAMGTPAGFAAFRHPPINAAIKQILEAWRVFLDSPKSLYVLNDSPSGWKSPAARAAIGIDDYEHDPSDTHWGFASWNDFFIRRFKPGRRPIAEPSNARAIANACESTPYAIARNVNKYDTFWLKSQPYSLHDMLAGDEAAKRFVGGTVYQAFLSALNYHRWHSPVAGTVRKAVVLPGTYYSELEAEGEDPAGPDNSQGYITHVATRALILIESDEAAIGLMGFLAVGMSEISSCVIGPRISAGVRVEKGEEIGYFQYGGSTHCLIFGPGVIADFAPGALPDPANPEAPALRLGAKLATAN